MTYGTACRHGQLARQCDRCDADRLEVENESLRAQLAECERERDAFKEGIDNIVRGDKARADRLEAAARKLIAGREWDELSAAVQEMRAALEAEAGDPGGLRPRGVAPGRGLGAAQGLTEELPGDDPAPTL